MDNIKTKYFNKTPTKKMLYARQYYQINKAKKREYYDTYYQRNKSYIKQYNKNRQAKLPQEFSREYKEIVINLN